MCVLKCKMCGGNLSVTEGMHVVECDFCSTMQTLPNANNEKKTNLFNRANKFRMAGEFDHAEGIYESIIAEFPSEAEAYWGLCLCRYGIEYVDDPKTAVKIPTCHRTSYKSIFNDENYLQTISYSDSIAKSIYEREATIIDKLQKDIIRIANNEKPFDVFICYKETDRLGNRTTDSVYAQDIYDYLTEKGFNVFFARITLEDKLGKEYEPYIFAALNSAKVMLVVGTNGEHYNSVWVKNEWSRYLSLMKNDRSKTLIPCYINVNPYDMPDEFRNLQGQDMGKIGFIQDLSRGIAKIVRGSAENAPSPTNDLSESMIKRGFFLLADGEYKSADEYFNKVLEINTTCAQAYLGKYLAEVKVRNEESLGSLPRKYKTSSKNLKHFLEFATVEEGVRITKAISNAERIYEETYAHLKEPRERFRKLAQRIYCGSNTTNIVLLNGSIIGTGQRNNIKKYNLASIDDAVTIGGEFAATNGAFIDFLTYSTSSGDIKELRQNFFDDGKIANSYPNAYEWKNVVKCVCSYQHTVGLLSNGTVVASGNNLNFSCNVSSWRDIIDVACGADHTVGLKRDGTVEACGAHNYYDGEHLYENEINDGQCKVEAWKEIAAICCSGSTTFGIKTDGTVCAAGYALKNKNGENECLKWKDIVGISAGRAHVVGLKSDGSVVACGNNEYGQCNVSAWQNVVVVACGKEHTIAIQRDGTILTAGNNYDGQCDIKQYKFFFDKEAEKEYYKNVFAKRQQNKQCRYCGGSFKGLFKPRCTNCGEWKID